MKSEQEKIEEYKSYILSAYLPDPIHTVSTWADENRFLSQRSSAEPGRWRTKRTPYLKEIMDTLSNTDRTEMIVFMKGSQLGGTEAGNNWLGYIIDHVPGPIMLVQPTTEMAKRNSKIRIDPLIQESPSLSKKCKSSRKKHEDNTVLSKNFPGGTLVMTGANSSAGLRSLPARYIFLDEIDAYPGDVGGEGDPVDLALARARTFSKRKIFLVSTPTISGGSRIEDYFEASDKRYFFVPCPDCGHYQTLKFKNLKWPKGLPQEVRYICEKCSYKIQNWQKTSMLSQGRWQKTAESTIAGFHVNSLYSPVGWYSWSEIASLYEKSKNNQDKRKAFVNTILGETYKDSSETPDWHRLYERRETYKRNVVPKDVCFLTMGVDIQKDRIEAEIVGWCENKITYSIDYRVLLGDTTQPLVWSELDKLINSSFPLETKPSLFMPIKLTAIDSGFNTQTVYNFCRKYSPTFVVPIKGVDHLAMIISQPKSADVRQDGRVIKRGLKVWPIGVKAAKMELYSWLRQNKSTDGKSDPHGYCHFPEYGPDYFQQLTAEELKTKKTKGFAVTFFEKIRNRNEALDCRVYARAAASICGIDRFTSDDFQLLKRSVGGMIQKDITPKQPRKKRRENTWL